VASQTATDYVNNHLKEIFHTYGDNGVDIYVSVGYDTIPLQNKVLMAVFGGKTIVQAAKEFRKEVAENMRGFKMKPSELYWAIFAYRDDKIHILASDNFPGIYDEKLNPQGILCNVNIVGA
jgi:hypothetical protein